MIQPAPFNPALSDEALERALRDDAAQKRAEREAGLSTAASADPEIARVAKTLAVRCLAASATLLRGEIRPLDPDGIRLDPSAGALDAAERLVKLAERLDMLGDKAIVRGSLVVRGDR